MTVLTVDDLTQTTLEGEGVFDVLMRANKVHLDEEYTKNRIKGAEYATVYLGSLESVMRTSLEFILQRQRIALEADLMAQQILLAQVEVTKATAAVALVNAQTANAIAELAIIQANALKVPAEIAQLTAQTAVATQQKLNLVDDLLTSAAQRTKITADTAQTTAQTAQVTQQTSNLVAEALNIPKQGAVLDAQSAHTLKQTSVVDQEILIKQQQVLVSTAEVAIAQAKLANIPKEGLQLDAQTAMTTQQTVNLVSEELLTDAKVAQATQQTTNLAAEALNIPKQGTVLTNQAAQITQQTSNLVAEATNIAAKTTQTTQQTANLTAEGLNISKQGLQLDAQTSLTNQQIAKETANNFIHLTDVKLSGTNDQQRQVLVGQKCKLDAEFDLLQSEKLKSISETALLTQKNATEKAQVTALGVDADSVVGRQKELYVAQTGGFARDAEQKAAKLLVDTWNVRRTTDEATIADATNKLSDTYVGTVVQKMLTGIGA